MSDTKTNPMNLVTHFMQRFNQSIPLTPSMPTLTRKNLRWRLIDEESKELRDARNVTEYLDAVVDLLYVVYGAALDAGFSSDQIDLAFVEVHRSNMSKMWRKDELGSVPEDALAQPVGEDRYIVRRNDGKIIKSPFYSPANLAPFCEEAKP